MRFPQLFAPIPHLIRDLLAREPAIEAMRLIGSSGSVRILGMGGSYNAAVAAANTFVMCGLDARAELASQLLRTGCETVSGDSAIVLLSESGTSIETNRVAATLRARGHRKLLCITNRVDSELAASCDVTIEQNLTPATRRPIGPFAASFLSLYQLACRQAGTEVADPAAAVSAAADLVGRAASIAHLCRKAPPCVEVFGRAALTASAAQAVLIIREIARVPASAWESSNYRHGPIEALTPSQLCLVIAATAGREAELDRSFFRAIRGINEHTFVIGPADGDVPVDVPAEYLPLFAVIPPACLAYSWGEEAGVPVGEFRYTSHTITDEG